MALTAAAVGVALVAYAAICGYTALALTQPERQPFRLFPEQDGLAYESVSFASRVDAVLLDGWLLLPPDAAPPRLRALQELARAGR